MIFNTGSLGEITKRIEVYIEGLRIGLTLEQEATWSSSLGQTQSLAHTSCWENAEVEWTKFRQLGSPFLSLSPSLSILPVQTCHSLTEATEIVSVLMVTILCEPKACLKKGSQDFPMLNPHPFLHSSGKLILLLDQKEFAQWTFKITPPLGLPRYKLEPCDTYGPVASICWLT